MALYARYSLKNCSGHGFSRLDLINLVHISVEANVIILHRADYKRVSDLVYRTGERIYSVEHLNETQKQD